MKVSASKQTWNNLESVFSVTKGARKYPLSFGLAVGRWKKCLTRMHDFSLLQTFQAKQRSQHREALSPLPSSRPLPPCWAISTAAQPCSYCWGKQKTTAMWHQTGLHHVYAMTEAWAWPQRGWAPAAAQTDSPPASRVVLQRRREQKGPWRSRPATLSFHREAQRQGRIRPRSCGMLGSGLGDMKGGVKAEVPGWGRGGVSFRFMGGCSQLLPTSSLLSNQRLAFNLRSLSPDKQGNEGRGDQASERSCSSVSSHLGRYRGMRAGRREAREGLGSLWSQSGHASPLLQPPKSL